MNKVVEKDKECTECKLNDICKFTTQFAELKGLIRKGTETEGTPFSVQIKCHRYEKIEVTQR